MASIGEHYGHIRLRHSEPVSQASCIITNPPTNESRLVTPHAKKRDQKSRLIPVIAATGQKASLGAVHQAIRRRIIRNVIPDVFVHELGVVLQSARQSFDLVGSFGLIRGDRSPYILLAFPLVHRHHATRLHWPGDRHGRAFSQLHSRVRLLHQTCPTVPAKHERPYPLLNVHPVCVFHAWLNPLLRQYRRN